VKLPREALAYLVESGYAVDIGHGWHRVMAAPKHVIGATKRKPSRDYEREIATFVRAVTILGSWSVSTRTGPSTVEKSSGTLPDEVLFRLRSVGVS
jgi:hypothetical protein